MSASCPFCGSAVRPRSRFCWACGRPLPQAPARTVVLAPSPPAPPVDAPVEATLPVGKTVRLQGDALDLREVINVVESGVRWWEASQRSPDAVTRAQAAQAIDELSRILQSLSQQVAQGRRTVRITTRLPELRPFDLACPSCGAGNRAGAKFCLRCGRRLADTPPPAAVESQMPLRLTVAARTDRGRVRQNNQDSIGAEMLPIPGGGVAYLALVADGMGGAAAGEYASRVAAEVIRAEIRGGLGRGTPKDGAWSSLLERAVLAANRRVYEDSRADRSRDGMGTTLTVALFVSDQMHLASVGDSRAYLINAGGVTEDGAQAAQLTSDHSLVARLVDIGQITAEQARVHPQRNILYRSVGTDPSVAVDTRSQRVEPGDIVVLCSDGLFNHVRDEEIAQAVLQQPDAERAADQLVALANERGGRDNISVVIVQIHRGT